MRRPCGGVLPVAALLVAGCAGTSHPGTSHPRTGHPADDGVTEAVTLPLPEETRLENGVRLLLVPDRSVPIVEFTVRIAGGALEDPAGKEGSAALLAALLGKGAGERDAAAFQDAVDHVGASLDVTAGTRWISIRGEFLAEDVSLALELVTDMLRRPRLDGQEFLRERGQAVDAVREARQEPNSLIDTYQRGWLFADHPYGRPPSGDETSLAAVSHEDVRALAARQLTPSRPWIAVGGDFDPDQLTGGLRARLAEWEAAGVAPREVPAPSAAAGRQVLLVDKPDALQTYFRFGNVSITRAHPDYPARYLANTVLGGRFTSRLNTALRIESGLSYGASSSFDDTLGGQFGVRSFTATATSEEAIRLAEATYRKFVLEGITEDELQSARAYVKGQYAPGTVETAGQAAAMLLSLRFDGLDENLVNGLFGRWDALTAGDVDRVIRDHFPLDDLCWTVIGRAEVLRPFLGDLGDVTETSLSGPGFAPPPPGGPPAPGAER